MSSVISEQQKKLTHCSPLVCSIHVYKETYLPTLKTFLQVTMNFLCPLKRLENLSCSCEFEYITFNFSELLSVASSISPYHGTEQQYHLSNNPHLIHKTSRYKKLVFISHTVQSLKVPGDVQQCTYFTVCWINLCDLL